jgi:hypothetical protein
MNTKILVTLLLTLSSAASFANIFTDETDLSEASNVIAHCGTEAKSLVTGDNGGNWIELEKTRHEKLDSKSDRKTYILQSYRTAGLGVSEKAKRLTIILTATQTVGRLDAPATTEYKCSVK